MPTPVPMARQCLTEQSIQALNDAVAVARKRNHAQTTSLHAVSAFLSLPSSTLRAACSRARNNVYSSRIQFKALELCLSVSLDRLPSSSSTHRVDSEPPVSNSLMAAIKRSQANQRRQPENYYNEQQQQQQQCCSVSMVKVELENLIVSILDDPVVSRVFGEAGFRNSDIKLAVTRHVRHQMFPSNKLTIPLFLCNFSDAGPGYGRFSFPFPGFSLLDDDADVEWRRVVEVLGRSKGRNPLLVGVCAGEVVRGFGEFVGRRKGSDELMGLELRVVSVEDEVMRFVSGDSDTFEVGGMVRESGGGGVVVCFGDLKVLIGEGEGVEFVVSELSRLLKVYGKRVWIIGVCSGYETYLKFLKRFPSVEKDWDLQLLPITATTTMSSKRSVGESCTRSSFTESFVPLGGFFSTPSEVKSPLGSANQCASRCHLCNEKCEEEVMALSNVGFSAAIAYRYPSSLPSWLEMPEINRDGASDSVKANGRIVMSAKVVGIQRKWDNICQRLHYSPFLAKPNKYQPCSQVPTVVGFQVAKDAQENVSNHNNANASLIASGCRLVEVEKKTTELNSSLMTAVSKSMNVRFSETTDERGGLISSPQSWSSSGFGGMTSPTTITSVMTNLGLGIKLSKMSSVMHEFPGCLSANGDGVTAITSNHMSKSYSGPWSDPNGQLDHNNFKKLYTILIGKVGRQEEAVIAISQTIARCTTIYGRRRGASRGDIWFNFLGPDRLGKKKLAVSLAEYLYGETKSFICVDLSFEDNMNFKEAVFGRQEMNDYDIKFRGKTIVDYIADELRKKPLSVVYLENIDKSDPQVQGSLSYAVRTGRLSDSYGREVSVANAVFITTSGSPEENKNLCSTKDTSNYCEENILNKKGCPIHLLVGIDLGDNVINQNSRMHDVARDGSCSPVFLNKRKQSATDHGTERQHQILEMAKRVHTTSKMPLDLNLPAEESETSDTENPDNDPISDNSKAWMDDFQTQMDETVMFKPIDLEKLADIKMNEITRCFHMIVGSEGSLEIDPKVMQQILAAECSYDSAKVKEWVDEVLGIAFKEAKTRYNLSSRSVVKLVTCEEQEQASQCFLPARIIMT